MPVKESLALEQPYPGLRSFEANESLLFHGRGRHTEELLRRLAQNRFLAVVGGSGSGKSSLVKAGLLPALYRGYLVGATSKWRVAVMRPGSAPLHEMTKALAKPEALGRVNADAMRESSFGLVNAVRDAGLGAGESLLLVVDQFEELFRFRRTSSQRDGGAEAALFVSQLLQAADEYGAPIYVALTMRSDFLGDCAQFPGLPEALNRGQYLIPRMSREQRREAITDALDFFDCAMSDRLTQRLLNDAGDDPDQLPVLQHALRQTYGKWRERGGTGEIDLQDYAKAGTMDRALHEHAQKIYESIDLGSRWLAERIFRCVTVFENGRAVRRPAKLGQVLKVIGVAGDQNLEPVALRIVTLFAARENSFLVVGRGDAEGASGGLDLDAVVDISHESLIRKWDTLKEWVKAEARVAEVYRYLQRDAGLYPKDAGLWSEPDLGNALKSKAEVSWNQWWAEQYRDSAAVTFAEVEEFLAWSMAAEAKRRTRERWNWWLLRVGVVVLIGLVGVGVRLFQLEQENRRLQATRAELAKQAQFNGSEVERLKRAEADRQRKIDQLSAAVASGNSAARAELERLKQAQATTKQSLDERTKLAQASDYQAKKVSNDYAEALNRITDLQKQLSQAWKERDQARGDLQKLADKPEVQQQANPPVEQSKPRAEAPVGAPGRVPVPAARQIVNPKDGLTYVRIPAGEFLMGCSPKDKECLGNEKPARNVKIGKSFYIGETEVTQEAYRRVTGKTPSLFKGDRLPVEQVNWEEATSYCKAVGLRLPSEAEWEYAARAGTTGARYGPIDQVAWYSGKSLSRTHEGKGKSANAWGLYDMLGNVWEWVEDWIGQEYRNSAAATSRGPSSAGLHGVRGGSWANLPRDVRVSLRSVSEPLLRTNLIGFRCAGEF
jgi:formylglycine-generating enzyme required for sulfatase activity